MLTFALPTAADREQVLSFYREFEDHHETCIGCCNFHDFDLWLRGMENRHTGTDLPPGYVRENFYLCYEGDILAGVFSLKFELTDYLLQFGGHVGYAVRPSLRRRGLATQMLRQGLSLARGFGFSRILAVCNEDNIASETVILRCGGVPEDERYDPEEQVTVRRFWIDL